MRKFHSCDLIVIVCVPATRACHISQYIQCQLKANVNTIRLVHEWRKSNHTVRSYYQNVTPYPQKALLKLSRGVFLQPGVTSYSIIANSPEVQFWTPLNNDHSLGHFLTHGSGTNSFIHTAFCDNGCSFVNLMMPSMLRKMAKISTFHHRFQHVIP